MVAKGYLKCQNVYMSQRLEFCEIDQLIIVHKLIVDYIHSRLQCRQNMET